MRTLLLFRGSAGCGKSTFIKTHDLEQYTLSTDKIRLFCQSPILLNDGEKCISGKCDKYVWDILLQLLEQRMIKGDFTVIDATNSKPSEFQHYKALASKYRYRIVCIDMTDIPINEVKRRNKLREEYKQVPEYVIDKMYSNFKSQNVPCYVKLIKPEEFEDVINYKPLDFSEYTNIHIIGDLHGCYTALKEYLKDGLSEEDLYIFTGDYVDRGIENGELLNFLMDISTLENVILLEGNHEKWLWKWANNELVKSPQFNNVTKKELEKKGISQKKVRKFYRLLRQVAYFTYYNNTFVVTHGGISTLPDNLIYIATEQLIEGVGTYADSNLVDDNFCKNTAGNIYQVHGHRNIFNSPIKVNDRCFNLEGGIEFGGDLRVLKLSNDGSFNMLQTKNIVFFQNESIKELSPNGNANFLDELRNNRYIFERKLDNNISSFNFTKDAFYDKVWDNLTIKARGLFINTNTKEIVARSYEKFFNIDEVEATELNNLQRNLKFPITAYIKENGYLGICGYNSERDELVFTSKSTTNSDYAVWFWKLFTDTISPQRENKVLEYLKSNNCSLVFEVIDVEHDRHIIKYPKSKIVLLDIVYNNMKFLKMPFNEVEKFADEFGFEHKKLYRTFNNWFYFINWYSNVVEFDCLIDEKYIEGFVIEDSKGFMTKLKLPYYIFWKHMRTIKERLSAKKSITLERLNTPLSEHFYQFLKSLDARELDNDIISLRDMYYKNYKGENI